MATKNETIQALFDRVTEALDAASQGRPYMENGGVWAIRSERNPQGLTGRVVVSINDPTTAEAVRDKLQLHGHVVSALQPGAGRFYVSPLSR